MKKTLLSFLLILGSVFSIYAQKSSIKFGLKGGINLSNVAMTPSDSEIKKSMNLGLMAGGFVEIGLSNQFAIQPELLFNKKGYKFETTYKSGTTTETLSYLSIPILVKFKPISSLYFDLGPEISFLIGAKDSPAITYLIFTKDKSSYYSTTDLKEFVNTLDLGLSIGTGFDFTRKIGAEFRYTLGLSNTVKNASTGNSVKNGVIQISLHYSF